MTNQEIKIAGFRLFEKTATAMMNVANGCKSDTQIVEANMPRLVKMVEWFKANDLMPDFTHFAYSGTFNVSDIHFYTDKLYEQLVKDNN